MAIVVKCILGLVGLLLGLVLLLLSFELVELFEVTIRSELGQMGRVHGKGALLGHGANVVGVDIRSE